MGSLDDLAQLPCNLDGNLGAISISFDAADHVVLTCVVQTTPPPPPDEPIKINEFMTGVSGAAADEFVEIVNTGTSPVDISGFKLVYRSATGTSDTTLATVPDGTTLAAGAFYLFGGSGYVGPPTADQGFSTGLSGTAGGIGIRDGSGSLLDSVGYGSTAANAFVETSPAPAPPAAAAPGSSAGRHPDGNDTNANASDFTVSSTPSPKGTNGT